jgi:hypothetical protein
MYVRTSIRACGFISKSGPANLYTLVPPTVLRFFVQVQNVRQQNVRQQNVRQQNVRQQNVRQQNVEIQIAGLT